MRATRPAPSLAHSAHSALKRWITVPPCSRTPIRTRPRTHLIYLPLSTFYLSPSTTFYHRFFPFFSFFPPPRSRLSDSADTPLSFLATTLPSRFVLCSLSLSLSFSSCCCRYCSKSQLHQTKNAFLPSFPLTFGLFIGLNGKRVQFKWWIKNHI